MEISQLLLENTWSVTLGLLVIVIGLWLRWRKSKFTIFKQLGIPGPEPNIIFGNLWEMSKKTPITCHKEWIEKYGKVVGYYFGLTPTLLVADVDLVKKILVKDFHKFSNRPQLFQSGTRRKEEPFTNQLTLLRDKRWKEIRSIITPSFTTSKMRIMSQTINSAVDSLLEIVRKKSKEEKSFDIYNLFKGLTMDVIGRTAFGIQTDCQNNPDDVILKASRSIFAGNFSNILTLIALSFPEFRSFWRHVNRIRLTLRNSGSNPITDLANVTKDVIEKRRSDSSNHRRDLLQIMLDAGVSESEFSNITDDQLTAGDGDNDEQDKKSETSNGSVGRLRHMADQEIIDNALLFFLAGYETTSTALAFTTHFILHYPDVQKRLREEIQNIVKKEGKLDYNAVQQMTYLDQVIAESLRMYPPIYLFVNREASEDVEYGPHKIKKGMSIQIPVFNMNHDPDIWPEPEKFDPSRVVSKVLVYAGNFQTERPRDMNVEFSADNKAKHNSMSFMTFGAGPRNCVGMRFAQLEAKLALARLLEKYELLPTEKTDAEPINLKVSVGIMSPARGINLRVKPI